jgi:hypothetical protein
MMEDLLLIKEKDKSIDSNIQQPEINVDHSSNNSNSSKSDSNKKENKNDEENEKVEIIIKPPEKLLVNYNKWHYFLITWKRLELLKLEWVRRKLGIEQINTPEKYARYW